MHEQLHVKGTYHFPHLFLWITVVVLCASLGYLASLVWSMQHAAPVQETIATDLGGTLPNASEQTLGAAVNCPAATEVQQLIMREIPAIYFDGMGKNNKVLSTSEVLSCITLPSCTGSVSCSGQKFTVDEPCIASAIQRKKLFSQTHTKLKDTLPNETPVSVVMRQEDYELDFNQLAKTTAQLITTRLNYCSLLSGQFKSDKLYVPIPLQADLPSTDGTLSNKYIEIDGSRQMMWLWRDGKVAKQFRTSGAFAEYNPVGIHTILNKSRRAWSSTAKKWMPYWMAFTYDKKQKTWFGIHALVYWFPDFEPSGEYVIKEPESNIGKPRSTGCIRLGNKEAEEVYNWTSIGDLVVVHD